MMTKWGVAGLLTMATFMAASLAPAHVGSADDRAVVFANSPEPLRNLLERGLVDWHEYAVALTPGTMPSLTVDWTTGTTQAMAVPIAEKSQAHPLGSGCTLPATFTFGNIVNPLGVGTTCTLQTHTTPITLSSLTCTVTSFCFTLVINFNFLNFGLFEFFCLAPGGAATWSPGSGVTASATCFAFFFGSLPNTYTLWEGSVGKDAAGPSAVAFHLD